MNRERGFSGADVCRIAGVSYRQLDYWDRTGLVRPSVRAASGSGSRRLYTFEDVVRLRLIVELLATGVSLQRIRRGVEYLDSHDETTMLVSDGRGVAALEPDAITRLVDSGRGFWAISLDVIRDALERELLPRKAAV